LDRDTLFLSSFCTEHMRLIEVEHDKLSAYHPQTDRQTERVNWILKHYIITHCVWDQDDWVELLPCTEFCYNNTVLSATKQIPSFVDHYEHPENNFSDPSSTFPESNNLAAIKTVETIHTVRDAMKENMKAVQERMCKYYNRKVSNEEPKFKVVDCIIVNLKNMKTKRLTKKLDYKLRGKFQIEKLVDTYAYSFKLPHMCYECARGPYQ